MTTVHEFLNDNDIDVSALTRIKHRLFVVGRFNQRNKGPLPDVYLFTNRSGLSERFTQNFTEVWEMAYENFVKALRPAIAETVVPGRIPMVLQTVPQGDEALEGSSVIDTFNFFFQRAVANSEQKAFAGSQPGLPSELLREDERERGKGIFKLIRKNLNLFSSFQPRTYEIVDAVSRLLGCCGKEHRMPPYATGGALPGGFPERLIDYVYAEDSRKPFSAEGLDFSSPPWDALNTDQKARDMFCNVVTAFRDALLASNKENFNKWHFRGKTLNQQAREVLKGDLISEFGKARDAYNGLRQILRSKVLLSMVLEWLLKAYYEIDAVKALRDKDDYVRDRTVEKAILQDWEANGLARPIKRASLDERRTFSKSLTENFERLLNAVLADDAGAKKAMAGLPPEIRELAESTRKNPELRRILSGISGKELGSDYQKGFVEASKIVLLDVLCPALFQIPILSVQMLRRFFRQETIAAYLAAVFLADKSQEDVRKIAERHIDYFQSKIDDMNLKIRDSGEIQTILLSDFLGILAKPEIQRRLKEGLRVLTEAHTILENETFEAAPGQEPGAGKISAIAPDPDFFESPALERTQITDEQVRKPLANVVKTNVERILEKVRVDSGASATAAATASVASASGNRSGGAVAVETEKPSAAEANATNGRASTTPLPEEEILQRSEIEQKAESAVTTVLERLFPAGAEQVKSSQVSSIIDKATQELTAQKGFLPRVKNDVRAFEQALYLVYKRYNENKDKHTFRNRVERMTLINMMLLFQKELGLGQVCSNLYHLLLDMVQHLDPENPDPAAFLKEKSLTIYFDNAVLADGGITDLRETLDAQAYRNLQATVDFVSELRGVKYLMDTVSKESEIVVVNATATEFLDWLRKDNFDDLQVGRERLQSGKLVKSGEHSETVIQPGLVYLTDIAFADLDKESFLDRLAQFDLRDRDRSIMLPPLCISTRHQEGASKDQQWIRDGQGWAAKASEAPAPVIIVGPASLMNKSDDAFKTYLPAGYPFAAHFLCAPTQNIQNRAVPIQSTGRFRILGFGAAPMKESLQRAIWGESKDDTYAFAVDFYLYIVLTVLATAVRRGGEIRRLPDAGDLYKCFYYTEDVMNKRPYDSSRALNEALLGGDAHRFAMRQDLSTQTQLRDVSLRPEGTEGLLLNITDVAWFNQARERAGIM